MNKNIKIRVKTPLGMTETKEAGTGPSQGSVDAALISANSIGNGVKEALNEEDKELKYNESLVLSGLSFMDDIGRMSEDRDKAQYGNDRIEDMINRKGLEFNLDKSNFLLIGNKRELKRMQKELDANPLKLCSVDMKQVKVLKYLGDFLTSDLAESVHETVLKRVNIATLSIYEIRGVIEDRRARCIGGDNVGLNIFTQVLSQ